MEKKNNFAKRNFKSRSSLTKSKNSELSYKERLALSGRKPQAVEFKPIDDSGYMKA